MTKAFKFTFFRKSIIEEVFEVEADTLEEAEEIMYGSGSYPDPVRSEWVDWYGQEFSTDGDFPPEPLCPLHRMIKEHECDTTS